MFNQDFIAKVLPGSRGTGSTRSVRAQVLSGSQSTSFTGVIGHRFYQGLREEVLNNDSVWFSVLSMVVVLNRY